MSKLNRIEVLISKTLIDSVISHHEFVLSKDVLKEYEEIKEETKILIINKYARCNKRKINIRKRIY